MQVKKTKDIFDELKEFATHTQDPQHIHLSTLYILVFEGHIGGG